MTHKSSVAAGSASLVFICIWRRRPRHLGPSRADLRVVGSSCVSSPTKFTSPERGRVALEGSSSNVDANLHGSGRQTDWFSCCSRWYITATGDYVPELNQRRGALRVTFPAEANPLEGSLDALLAVGVLS